MVTFSPYIMSCESFKLRDHNELVLGLVIQVRVRMVLTVELHSY